LNQNKKISRDDLIRENAELKGKLSKNCIDSSVGAITKWIPWLAGTAMTLYGLYTLSDIIQDIAGKKTIFDFNITIAVSIIATIAGGGAVILWQRERFLRKKDIERLTKDLNKCREKLDPNKGSSGLSKNGDTNKEDEP
jgi:hypothetical protein